MDLYNSVLHDPKLRDPRGYISCRSARFRHRHRVRQRAAQERHHRALKATAAFQVAERVIPAGSYVVKTAQAFRPHMMDMFEPQDHPNDFAIPAARRIRPTTSPAGRWPCRWA
jgi:hypothetical protein